MDTWYTSIAHWIEAARIVLCALSNPALNTKTAS